MGSKKSESEAVAQLAEKELELLNVVGDFLDQRGLTWYLAETSLAAALWDDSGYHEQTIALARSDFEQLVGLRRGLPAGCKLSYLGSGSWKRLMARIWRPTTIEANGKYARAWVNVLILESGTGQAHSISGSKILNALRNALVPGLKSNRLIRAFARRRPVLVWQLLRRLLPHKKGEDFLLGIGANAKLEQIAWPATWFVPGSTMAWHGRYWPVPVKADEVLARRYGNKKTKSDAAKHFTNPILGTNDSGLAEPDTPERSIDQDRPQTKRDRFGLERVQYDTELWHELQLELTQLLVDFDELCSEHQLTYYLGEGTLLGAIRHQGFIPWDDDLDVVMPRPDYQRLVELLGDSEMNHCLLFDKTTWGRYYLTFAKIVTTRDSKFCSYRNPLPRKFSKPFIDIFPLDKGLATEPGRLIESRRRWRDALFFKKRVIMAYRKRANWRRWLLSCIFTPHFMQNRAERLYRMYENHPAANYWVNFASSYRPPKETFPPTAFGTGKRVLFEGHLLPVPQDADLVLRTIYGDYLTPPPIKERKPRHPPFLFNSLP